MAIIKATHTTKKVVVVRDVKLRNKSMKACGSVIKENEEKGK